MSWFTKLFKSKKAPPIVYEVKAFTLVVADKDYVQRKWESHYPDDRRTRNSDVGGFYNYETRTMYCDRDVWNPERPYFATLGHEVWHLQELGGDFHPNKRVGN